MNPEEAKKEEIIALAKEAERYCNLLIAQSDSWLPEVTDSVHTSLARGKCWENSTKQKSLTA